MSALNQVKLARLCRNIQRFCIFLLAALPAVAAWYWWNPAVFPLGGYGPVQQYAPGAELAIYKRIAGLAATAPYFGAIMVGIIGIFRLAGTFAAGTFISAATVRTMKLASAGLIAAPFMRVLQDTLVVLILTYDRAPGERILAIGIAGEDLLMLLMGPFLLALTGVFDVERERAEDQALIV